MSKAFTREDDSTGQAPLPRPSSSLPFGAKNYMTPQGAERVRAELESLANERNRLLEGSEEDKALRVPMLDQRILPLRHSLESAEVVHPPSGIPERVLFGATVTVRERGKGEETISTYRIVGVDETDIDQGWVSWISPIAKALLNTKVGQRVRFKFPSGEKELEVTGISYD